MQIICIRVIRAIRGQTHFIFLSLIFLSSDLFERPSLCLLVFILFVLEPCLFRVRSVALSDSAAASAAMRSFSVICVNLCASVACSFFREVFYFVCFVSFVVRPVLIFLASVFCP